MARTMLGQMEPFDIEEGEDWPTYIERLEQFFTANDVNTAEKKVATLLTVVGANTYALIKDLVAPNKPAMKELVKILEDHLNPKPLVISERFKFHQRNQKEGESIAQFLAALRRLAEHCDFGTTLEESLRDRLVCGMSNETIQRKLLTERDLTLARAYEIARSMETAQRQATQLQAVSQTAKEGQTSQEIHVHPVTREKGKGTDKTQCWRCGRTGHEDEKCYFRRKQCRKCNKYGHIAKMCKSETEGGTERKVHHTEVEEELTDLGLFAVDSGTDKNTDSFFAELGINGTPVRMEVDTGAAVTLVSEGVWEDKLGKIPLEDRCGSSHVHRRAIEGAWASNGRCATSAEPSSNVALDSGCWKRSCIAREELATSNQA